MPQALYPPPAAGHVDLLGFYELASRLKRVRRAGWARRSPGADVESVADHSLMTALLSLVLAHERGLDELRCAAMAAVHDLAESVVGDILPDEVDPDVKHSMERDALQKILRPLGEDGSPLWRAYQEYEAGVTPEARLVHQIDKLEMALQAVSYYRDGVLGASDACEFVRGALRYIDDPEIEGYVRAAAKGAGLDCGPDVDPFISG